MAADAPSVLVTGAGGFVGRALCAALSERGTSVVAAVRRSPAPGVLPAGIETVAVGAVDGDTEWRPALAGIGAVVHLAGRAHVLREDARDPLAAFRRVNTAGTLRLAAQATAAGVGRFVFVSSVKVHGEAGHFSEADAPAPADPYGVSKWEAEQGLMGRDGIVVLRPPLVYGPHVKGNFAALLRLTASGLPVPVAATDNRRSLVHVGNLVSAIVLCLAHPAAPGRTYLVRDGEDVSPRELVRRLARALGRRPRLLPLPPLLLRLAASALGRPDAAQRLTAPLTVDDRLIRRELGWQPPCSLSEGLESTATWFRNQGA